MIGLYLFYRVFLFGLQAFQVLNYQANGVSMPPLMYAFFGVHLALAIVFTTFAPQIVMRLLPNAPSESSEAPTVESLSVLAVLLAGILFLVPAIEWTLLHSWQVIRQGDEQGPTTHMIRALVCFGVALPFLFRTRKVAAWLLRCGSR